MKKLTFLSIKELGGKKPAEFEAYINEMKITMRDLIHDIATNKEKQTHKLKLIKRAIAKAKTMQTKATQGTEK